MVDFGEGSGVELRSIETPDDPIPPGGAFEVVANLYNHEQVVSGEDSCEYAGSPCGFDDSGLTGGWCLTVEASVGGVTERTNPNCLNVAVVPPQMEQWSFTMEAPDSSGTYDVTAFAETSNSGNRSPLVSAPITVSESATPVEDPNENGNGGDGNLLRWAAENPGPALALGGLGIVATRTAVESLIGD